MSDLLRPSDAFRPFHFPHAVELWEDHDNMHWGKSDVLLGEDVTDWKTGKLTEGEMAFVTQILRLFTQSDVEVGGFYHNVLIPRILNNEVRNLLASYAAREITHQHTYALLNDTLGLPEGEYTAFKNFKEMADKIESMNDADSSTHSGVALAMAKGVFNEGISLFASFAMLLSFQRRGLMKGMGKIVEYSIKDEDQHVKGVSWLFHTFCAEHPEIVTDQFKRRIYDMNRECVRLEDAFIDSAYDLAGEIQDLPREQVKRYIRFIADQRLLQLGLKENFMVGANPLPWLDWVVSATRHTNFFESRVTDYSKGGLGGEWDYPGQSSSFRVYTKNDCPWCAKAKNLLVLHGLEFEVVDLSDDDERQRHYDLWGLRDSQRTMPQVFSVGEAGAGETRVGGYTELKALLGEGA